MKFNLLSTLLFEAYDTRFAAKNYGPAVIDAMKKDHGADKNVVNDKDAKTKILKDANLQKLVLSPFEDADPSASKKFTLWMIIRYYKGDYLLEDLELVTSYLKKFIESERKIKADGKSININDYRSLGDLKELITSIYGEKEHTQLEGLYPVLPDTKVLYNGPEGQFVIPLTVKSSQALQNIGKETEWCTADSRAPTQFPIYSKKGRLFIWIDKKTGEKYQFHFGDGCQFKNKFDKEISKEKRNYFLKKFEITSKVLLPALIDKVKKTGSGLQYVPEELRTPELCKIAVQKGYSLVYVPKKLRTPELCKIAVQQNGYALKDVPEELQTAELCKLAVQQDGWVLEYVTEKLKTPEICKLAVEQYGNALRYVPEELRTAELCKLAVQQNGNALYHVPEELRTAELCKLAVQQKGHALYHVPKELRTAEMCKLAVQQNGAALNYVPKKLRTEEMCKLAVQQNRHALGYVPYEIWQQVKQELGL